VSKPPVIPPLKSREEVERALGELANEERVVQEIEAGVQRVITAAREKAQPELTEHSAKAVELRMRLQAWADKEDFGERKSTDFLHGTIGFRLGQRQLKLRSKWKMADVLERLVNRMTDYVRRTAAVDKEKILRDSAGESPVLDAKAIEAMGLRVVQEEHFFIDLKEL
jgi:phage host-nuclease inhibitor protein Gam